MSFNGAVTEEESEQRIPIIVFGLEGYAEKSCGGWGFYGKWASHTGYRHTHGSELDKEGLLSGTPGAPGKTKGTANPNRGFM